jgi:DnaJ-class molecular chaperone
MNTNEETKAARKALKEAGIPARVSHGRGTVYCWIYVNVLKPAGPDLTEERVLAIVKKATGRETRSREYDEIMVDFARPPCPRCEGSGWVHDGRECPLCFGTGKLTYAEECRLNRVRHGMEQARPGDVIA